MGLPELLLVVPAVIQHEWLPQLLTIASDPLTAEEDPLGTELGAFKPPLKFSSSPGQRSLRPLQCKECVCAM